jgi:autotransporter adhesin
MKFKLSYIAAAATSMACSFAGAQITTTYGVGASAQINGTAIGTTANAGEQAVAVGGNANAGSQGAVAVGGCTNIVCIENGVVVNRPLPVGTGSTAIGSGAMTPGDQATALGANASATHVNAVALGAGTQTTRDNAVAVGGRQITSVAAGSVGTDAVNVDQFNTGLASTLSDANAYTDRRDAATLNQANSYTDGKTRYFQANSSAAASIATGRDTVSIGPGAIGSGNNAIAGGKGAIAGADDTVGFGAAAQATAAGAVAVGSNANAIGASSAALGNRARAVNANDVALGAGSTTATAVGTRGVMLNGRSYTFAGTAPTSTVSVGTAGSERTITNVAAGRLSGTSTDAVNGSQLNATNTTLSALGDNMNVLGTSTAANLGGGAAYDPKTGLVSAPGYVLNGVSYNSAGGFRHGPQRRRHRLGLGGQPGRHHFLRQGRRGAATRECCAGYGLDGRHQSRAGPIHGGQKFARRPGLHRCPRERARCADEKADGRRGGHDHGRVGAGAQCARAGCHQCQRSHRHLRWRERDCCRCESLRQQPVAHQCAAVRDDGGPGNGRCRRWHDMGVLTTRSLPLCL